MAQALSTSITRRSVVAGLALTAAPVALAGADNAHLQLGFERWIFLAAACRGASVLQRRFPNHIPSASKAHRIRPPVTRAGHAAHDRAPRREQTCRKDRRNRCDIFGRRLSWGCDSHRCGITQLKNEAGLTLTFRSVAHETHRVWSDPYCDSCLPRWRCDSSRP
jgi:hypothetical protein